jgi:hypothetical protein
MASDAPFPSELHKVTIILDGSKFKPTGRSRRPKYLQYMKKLRALAKQHGARVLKPELQVKQRAINVRKRDASRHDVPKRTARKER